MVCTCVGFDKDFFSMFLFLEWLNSNKFYLFQNIEGRKRHREYQKYLKSFVDSIKFALKEKVVVFKRAYVKYIYIGIRENLFFYITKSQRFKIDERKNSPGGALLFFLK